jgi:hypothetical protein
VQGVRSFSHTASEHHEGRLFVDELIDRSVTAAVRTVTFSSRAAIEPEHEAPRPSSPNPCRLPTKAICCRIFTPALLDYPAASVKDFCSGAYNCVTIYVLK